MGARIVGLHCKQTPSRQRHQQSKRTMKAAWGLIVLAAELFQFGGLLSVRAETCADELFTCAGGTGPINPLPVTTCSGGACTSADCCETREQSGFLHTAVSDDFVQVSRKHRDSRGCTRCLMLVRWVWRSNEICLLQIDNCACFCEDRVSTTWRRGASTTHRSIHRRSGGGCAAVQFYLLSFRWLQLSASPAPILHCCTTSWTTQPGSHRKGLVHGLIYSFHCFIGVTTTLTRKKLCLHTWGGKNSGRFSFAFVCAVSGVGDYLRLFNTVKAYVT